MEETTRIYWAKRGKSEGFLILRSLDWARKLLQGNLVVYLPREAFSS